MSQPVKSVVILGGGTAGWITAGTLAARFKRDQAEPVSVTLIESPNVPTIGVGEGTWPTMRNTLKRMGVRETDFIRECNVGFKQGAKFARWSTGAKEDFYYHPLVLPEGFNSHNLAPHWLAGDRSVSFSNTVCPQEALCQRNLAPKTIDTPEYAAIANYAYHLDAGKFSRFLQEHCTENLGVRHILADVSDVRESETGDIAALQTDTAGEVSGDLFIDCSGFRSKLLGEHFGIPFHSCKSVLFIDTALAVQVPYEHENSPMATHTISTAQSAGWIWDIGLQNRRGVGHVYSSAHSDESSAYRELASYLNMSEPQLDELGVRKIPIVPGHREKFWHRNCVAVGLSAGFLEPLESSALVLVEISANMIAEQFPASRTAMDVVARRFNESFLYRWDRIIDFLKLHYVLTKRKDSEFWLDNCDPVSVPDSLKELLTLWRYQPPWHDDFDRAVEVFPAASYQYVLYGMGYETKPRPGGISAPNLEMAAQLFEQKNRGLEKMLRLLQPHRDLINKIRKFGLQKI
ncbi:tryptophan 7-halogenase [Microbulbifer thermotolerans]|uniref:tryptophan halogenase family protein n=1 Tax=Microbulbifer thermotolerans TaxID=252514 RepID=UPI002248A30E|nr:tryptophan halogenase family protein [Microbulbifer thermotolerans]MCX2784527.1 tryptophan 7-halogenase [Microbulbifer thermotolerans]MCX2794822.1 tryptophan 7-halogenase [Microbulbifer thermotolerans]